MKDKLQLADFIKALELLDSELVKNLSKGSPPICIKAIGGFALLYHSIRISGYTADSRLP